MTHNCVLVRKALVFTMWPHTPPPLDSMPWSKWFHTQATARCSQQGSALLLRPMVMCNGRWPATLWAIIWGNLKLGVLLSWPESL